MLAEMLKHLIVFPSIARERKKGEYVCVSKHTEMTGVMKEPNSFKDFRLCNEVASGQHTGYGFLFFVCLHIPDITVLLKLE